MVKFSRREFGVRLGTGAAAAGLMLGPRAARMAAAAGSQDLIVGIPGFPSGFDAAVSTGVSDFVLRNTLDSLVRLDEKLSPQPELAERWETPDEAKTWRFSLTKNASWHDGVPFTSRDVKVHFERVINPATGSPGEQIFGAIDRIETPDDHTVVFQLKAADSDFPAKHGSYEGLIQAAHIPPASYLKSVVGTGPFKLDKIVPGESIRLVKNAKYFQQDQPLIGSLTFVSFSDEQARLNALLSGHIQASVELPYEIAQQLSGRNDIYLSKSLPAAMLLLAMRVDQKPFDDVRVRKAISLSLDRDALLQVAVKGFGQAGGDNPIGPGRPYYVDVGVPSRDVAAAKALLNETGVTDAKLDLYVPGGVGGAQEMALGIQSMLAEIGMSVQVQTIPQDVYWAKYWIQQSMKVTNWSPRGTIDEQIRVTYYCNAAWDESHVCDTKLDDLLDEARRTVDQSKRAELYRKVQMHFSEVKPAIIPFHMSLVGAAAAGVKDFNQHPVYYWTDFRKVSLTT